MKLLNIGCGYNYHPDWINLDLYKSESVKYYNIKRQLPFMQNSVDAIYHSHVLEHLDKKLGTAFVKDCYRVLKPGGVIRIVVPDLEQICAEYLNNLKKGFNDNNNQVVLNYQWNKIEMLDQIVRKKSGGEMLETIKNGKFNRDYVLFRNGEELVSLLNQQREANHEVLSNLFKKIIRFIYKKHFFSRLSRLVASKLSNNHPQKSGEAHHWMYDRLDLKLLLEQAGFREFKIMKYNESAIFSWNKYALDQVKGGNYPRKPDSLFVEAIK